MATNKTIVVAYGDGIGPEIMEATLSILKHAKARINIETVEIGEQMYLKGFPAGITPEAWQKLLQHRVLLKAPMTTPQGKGFKSLNVTLRKSLGLFANVRPCASFYPVIDGPDSKMDMVIVRENEEDLYAGIEYKPSYDTAISHKMITRPGSEKIIRYAFEYARNNGRKKVTCLVKDNIMKIADGMFHEIFKTVAQEYSDIEANSIIVDIGAARIAARPRDFDVVVTLNLYGDIISDIAAEVSGSVGLAGSSNIGKDFGMFEAVHGSAPDIVGRGIANPSGLLNGAVLMLEYLKQYDIAETVRNAWLKTLEDGTHTADVFAEGISKHMVGTKEFADAVVANLGQKPKILPAYSKAPDTKDNSSAALPIHHAKKALIGVDFIIDAKGYDVEAISEKMRQTSKNFQLHSIAQRGLKIWPKSGLKPAELDVVTCRFIGFQDAGVTATIVAVTPAS
jgi:isocitrate dehydrogenase